MQPGAWKIPRLWPDGECYILGGGPGLKGLDLSPLQHKRTIAVNSAFKIATWIDMVYFNDLGWYRTNRDELHAFPGIKTTSALHHCSKPDIFYIHKRNAFGALSDGPQCITWNGSSGAAAINIAVHLGVKRIVLLGFDMRAVDGETHWHTEYTAKKKANGQLVLPYGRFLHPFPKIAQSLRYRNIECINATPDSALKEFPIMTFEEALNGRRE